LSAGGGSRLGVGRHRPLVYTFRRPYHPPVIYLQVAEVAVGMVAAKQWPAETAGQSVGHLQGRCGVRSLAAGRSEGGVQGVVECLAISH